MSASAPRVAVEEDEEEQPVGTFRIEGGDEAHAGKKKAKAGENDEADDDGDDDDDEEKKNGGGEEKSEIPEFSEGFLAEELAKDPKLTAASDASGSWECPVCTYVNVEPSAGDVCSVCYQGVRPGLRLGGMGGGRGGAKPSRGGRNSETADMLRRLMGLDGGEGGGGGGGAGSFGRGASSRLDRDSALERLTEALGGDVQGKPGLGDAAGGAEDAEQIAAMLAMVNMLGQHRGGKGQAARREERARRIAVLNAAAEADMLIRMDDGKRIVWVCATCGFENPNLVSRQCFVCHSIDRTEARCKSLALLGKILAKIVAQPAEPKFRRLRARAVIPKLASSPGLYEVLIQKVGFARSGEENAYLSLSMEASVERARATLALIERQTIQRAVSPRQIVLYAGQTADGKVLMMPKPMTDEELQVVRAAHDDGDDPGENQYFQIMLQSGLINAMRKKYTVALPFLEEALEALPAKGRVENGKPLPEFRDLVLHLAECLLQLGGADADVNMARAQYLRSLVPCGNPNCPGCG